MASHMEVAHRWAQGLEMSGDNFARPLKGFNMWSEGASIFSYGRHFEIARIVETPHSGRVVLFTRESYSVSTSKHITYTRRAIGYGERRPVFNVKHLDVTDFEVSHPDVALAKHNENLADYVLAAIEAHAKAGRARTYVQMHLDEAERSLVEASRYAETFEVPFERPALADLSERAAQMAKAEQERRREQAEKERQRREERRVIEAAQFEEWQAGGSVYCPGSYRVTDEGGAYLRRSPDGADLQTSQGAAVPWEHALKAFRFVKLIRQRGEGWQRNGHSVRVGHYALDSVAPDGSFVAGCHRINWREIEALARSEGVLDLAPSAEAETVTEGAH